jgi:hypothetical protein
MPRIARSYSKGHPIRRVRHGTAPKVKASQKVVKGESGRVAEWKGGSAGACVQVKARQRKEWEEEGQEREEGEE